MLPSHAILTGDLIRSTRAPASALQAAMDVLSQTTESLRWTGDSPHHFTRFRGDGWQIALARPELCFRAAVCLCAALRASNAGLATRIAIGIGPIETLGSADLSDGRGAAFVTSGRLLDGMGRKERIRIDGEGVTEIDHAIINLVAWHSARWSKPQAEAVTAFAPGTLLSPPPVYERLGITRQALEARLSGAGWKPLQELICARESMTRADHGGKP